MPVPATGQPDVGAADPQPAVLLRRRDQRRQQLAVGGLERLALGKREARLAEPTRERVPNLLQLPEPEHPRRPRGFDPVRHLDPPEPRRDQPRELQLEPPDLPPQLGPRGGLLDP
ncbi:MAG: hypothetical protein JSU06_14895 [Actinobacteria bacterium]|nr:hypothetical protein [Actinomycetota bacterium]